jgi:hypothetical protein
MAIDVALTTSPAKALEAIRGEIIDARLGYPEILQLSIRGQANRTWLLASQDADFSPRDPSRLVGLSITTASIETVTNALICELSDGSRLELRPTGKKQGPSDPPYWELLTPFGQVLQFGPGLHWQINEADAPVRDSR